MIALEPCPKCRAGKLVLSKAKPPIETGTERLYAACDACPFFTVTPPYPQQETKP